MLLKSMITAIKPKIYLNEYGIEKKSKTFFKLTITPDLSDIPESLISNETVGAINDRPIASSKPEIINKKDDNITANL